MSGSYIPNIKLCERRNEISGNEVGAMGNSFNEILIKQINLNCVAKYFDKCKNVNILSFVLWHISVSGCRSMAFTSSVSLTDYFKSCLLNLSNHAYKYFLS